MLPNRFLVSMAHMQEIEIGSAFPCREMPYLALLCKRRTCLSFMASPSVTRVSYTRGPSTGVPASLGRCCIAVAHMAPWYSRDHRVVEDSATDVSW